MTVKNNYSIKTTEYINPICSATQHVFENILQCCATKVDRIELTTDEFSVEENNQGIMINSFVDVNGKNPGKIVFSLPEETANHICQIKSDDSKPYLLENICNSVAELTNLIVANIKEQMDQHEFTISVANVISCRNQHIHFPKNIKPMTLSFESETGPFSIKFGFIS